MVGYTVLTIVKDMKDHKEGYYRWQTLIGFLIGNLFGFGLAISGMCRRTKINGFFTINENWDPSLAFVMGGAVGLNLFTFHYIINTKKAPILGTKLDFSNNTTIDKPLLLGAIIFGIGMGTSGFCPGPGLVNFFNFTHNLLYLIPYAIGAICVTKYF